MKPEWQRWVELHMPTKLQEQLWNHIEREKRYLEDEILRLQQSTTEAVLGSERRMKMLQEHLEREEKSNEGR